MGDLSTLIPGASALGMFAAVIGILIRYLITDRRLLAEADQRYREEVEQHEKTQQVLDVERERRRKAEDDLAENTRELSKLRHTVEAQTERISHLETEVSRLTGRPAA